MSCIHITNIQTLHYPTSPLPTVFPKTLSEFQDLQTFKPYLTTRPALPQMAALSAFDFPPLFGNAIAYVAYYAAFLAIQAVLSLRYLRTWNWPIFLGLGLFLIFEILGSVAYVEMHYTPVTGSLYTL